MLTYPNTHNPITEDSHSLQQKICSARHIFIPGSQYDSETPFYIVAAENIKKLNIQGLFDIHMGGAGVATANILKVLKPTGARLCDMVISSTISLACEPYRATDNDKNSNEKYSSTMAKFEFQTDNAAQLSDETNVAIFIETISIPRSQEELATDITETVMRAIEREILKATTSEVHLFISGVDGVPHFGRKLASMMDLYGEKLRVIGSINFCSPIDSRYDKLLSAPNTLVLECPNPEVAQRLLEQLDSVCEWKKHFPNHYLEAA